MDFEENLIRAQSLQDATILIVDDEQVSATLIEVIFRRKGGYTNIVSTNDPRTALSLCHKVKPDIVLLDLHMPHMNGLQVLQAIRDELPGKDLLPVVMLTADVTLEAKQRALLLGANDFIAKPFDSVEVLLRVNNLLHNRGLYQQSVSLVAQLELRVQERTRELEARSSELEASQIEILLRLAKASEFHNKDTGEHTFRVARICGQIGKSLGLPLEETGTLMRAARLHDVGMIGVPESTLLKKGKLSEDEFNEVKQHTVIGAELLGGGRSRLLQVAEEIALSHHEWWNGRGYPLGLQGEEIPLYGRIVAVADVYDILVNDRPYKAAWGHEQALAEIRRLSGIQFDPNVVEAFLSSVTLPVAI